MFAQAQNKSAPAGHRLSLISACADLAVQSDCPCAHGITGIPACLMKVSLKCLKKYFFDMVAIITLQNFKV